jgi:hypothetical protein
MSEVAIEGTWKGKITYGKTYPPSYRNKITTFTMDLRLNDKILSGTCEDDITKKLLLRPAIIEGVFSNYTLHFVKIYPCLILSDDQGNVQADPSKPAQAIQYNGSLYMKYFLFGKVYFKGYWDISGFYTDSNGVNRAYTIGGKFRMDKID